MCTARNCWLLLGYLLQEEGAVPTHQVGPGRDEGGIHGEEGEEPSVDSSYFNKLVLTDGDNHHLGVAGNRALLNAPIKNGLVKGAE